MKETSHYFIRQALDELINCHYFSEYEWETGVIEHFFPFKNGVSRNVSLHFITTLVPFVILFSILIQIALEKNTDKEQFGTYCEKMQPVRATRIIKLKS